MLTDSNSSKIALLPTSKTLEPTKQNIIKKIYSSPKLPLAVYREVVAHLRQVEGVEAGLINKPLQGGDEPFDYDASQIKALWLTYETDDSSEKVTQIQMILDFYAQRYDSWQLLDR